MHTKTELELRKLLRKYGDDEASVAVILEELWSVVRQGKRGIIYDANLPFVVEPEDL